MDLIIYWAPIKKLGGGYICQKDSPSPPAAPDYAGAATATAQGNLEATRAAAAANRVNQYTPYGSLVYSQTPTNTFDQNAYDTAMQAYQSAIDSYNRPTIAGGSGGQGPLPTAPDRSQFYVTNPDSGWSATTTLSPAQQQILDQNTALTTGLLGTAQKGLSYVDQLLADPTLDESKLPQSMINPGESYIDASMRLMQPQLDRQRSMFMTQMANQGIPTSSEAYQAGNQELTDNQQRAMLQAIQTGMAQNTAARQAGIQEQTYLQDRPLNIVNALRTGNQTTLPNFQSIPQQATTQGADLLGATQAQGQYNQGLYNANTASTASQNQGAAQIGAGLLTALAMFSDRRLKKNLRLIGKTAGGHNWYEFDFLWGEHACGVMSDEVRHIPGAVGNVAGFDVVDYSRVL